MKESAPLDDADTTMSRTYLAAVAFVLIAGTVLSMMWPRQEPRRAAAPAYSNTVYDPR